MYIFVEKLKWKVSSCLAPLRTLTCIWRDRVPVKQDPNPANIYMYIYIYIGWKEKTTAAITISRMCILRSEEYVCKICHKHMCTRCSTIYTLLFTFVWCITYVSLPHTILKQKSLSSHGVRAHSESCILCLCLQKCTNEYVYQNIWWSCSVFSSLLTDYSLCMYIV